MHMVGEQLVAPQLDQLALLIVIDSCTGGAADNQVQVAVAVIVTPVETGGATQISEYHVGRLETEVPAPGAT